MAGLLEQLDLAELNEQFELAEPQKIVAWAAGRFDSAHGGQFDDALVMSSSFGADSAVMLHMATQMAPRIKIIFVDTGYIFPQTHQFMEELRRRLDLNVWVYRTRNDPIEYLHRAGEENPAWRKDIDACCAANKNEPFERAMRDLAPRAWLRGIRRDQTKIRKDQRFIEWSDRYQCYAISPLLKSTSREIHGYLKKHDLPYHPLVEKGYSSIGCNPLSCTRAISADEDPRSGRWAGQNKVECGINLTNSLDSANL
jgi:phosphoadenosine phosphosulfate reductase